jgi:hypothetical protein
VNDLPVSLRRYGRQLERAVAADLARRRRRTRLAAVGAALLAVVVAVHLWPGGEDHGAVAPASAVERAAAALKTSAGSILHVHMLGRQFEDGRPDVHWESETWIGARAAHSIERPPVGPLAELEHVPELDRAWDARGHRVLEAPAAEADSASRYDDKFRGLALELLGTGKAHVAGHESVGGRDALRIVGTEGATYVVDARTYAPIEFRTRGTGGGTVLRFVAYERLPLTASSRRLLSISAAHGGAPVVRDRAAFRALQARLFAHG